MAARSIGFQNEVIFRQPLLQAKDKLKQKIEKLNTEFTNNYIE